MWIIPKVRPHLQCWIVRVRPKLMSVCWNEYPPCIQIDAWAKSILLEHANLAVNLENGVQLLLGIDGKSFTVEGSRKLFREILLHSCNPCMMMWKCGMKMAREHCQQRADFRKKWTIALIHENDLRCFKWFLGHLRDVVRRQNGWRHSQVTKTIARSAQSEQRNNTFKPKLWCEL